MFLHVKKHLQFQKFSLWLLCGHHFSTRRRRIPKTHYTKTKFEPSQTLPAPLLETMKHPNLFFMVRLHPTPFPPHSWDAWAAQTPPHASFWAPKPSPPHSWEQFKAGFDVGEKKGLRMFFLEVPRFFSIFPMSCVKKWEHPCPLCKRITPMSCVWKKSLSWYINPMSYAKKDKAKSAAKSRVICAYYI